MWVTKQEDLIQIVIQCGELALPIGSTIVLQKIFSEMGNLNELIRSEKTGKPPTRSANRKSYVFVRTIS